jgi:predicted ATPase/class 3 adenylate cyclase
VPFPPRIVEVAREAENPRMSGRRLPSGTLTFLFTDIEGSTKLGVALGTERYHEVLELHTRTLRAAFNDGGTEVRIDGDSLVMVFASAAKAVRAAAAAQRGLAAARFPHGATVRVRMGLHTGEGTLGSQDAGADYVGTDIVRAARIAAVAHGGQVLVSDATRAVVGAELPDGVRVRTLGTFRLKDLPVPERIHQLEIQGLPSAFPPLRALDVRRAHLPPEATTFIGRGAELEAVARLLAERHLVTLTGTGGTGKTRLALRTAAGLAERFADGAFFVTLAAITDATLLPAAVASALSLPEVPGRAPADVVREWLAERELLLVLDNLEQIAGAAGVIEALLGSSPDLRVLATSRSPLRIPGEQEFPVPPFAVPGRGAELPALQASDAVRLFVDRARLVRPDLSAGPDDFVVIAEIANRLDGLPLAIELAAARARLLPLTAIRDRLAHRLDALVGGASTAPHRQRSLRAAIAWSHDLLDEPGKALFQRLAVFVGGWTIEAAEAVAGGPPGRDVLVGLEGLAAQSLIQSSTIDREPRFAMLPTIGEFAMEQLEASGEAAEVRRRHAAFFRGVAETAFARAETSEATAWFDRLEADLDNLRAAIERMAADDPDMALGIAAALRQFWLQRNHSAEGQQVLIGLIERAGSSESREFAAAAAAASTNANWLGDYSTARRFGEVGVAAYRRLGDRPALAYALGGLSFGMIEVDPSAALAPNDEALAIFHDLRDVRGEGLTLLARATSLLHLGRIDEARASVERSIARADEAGDRFTSLFGSVLLARIHLGTGDIPAAIATYRSTLESSRAMDLGVGIAIGLEMFASLAIWGGDVRRAVRLGAAAKRLKAELGGGIDPRMGGGVEPLVVGRSQLARADFEREEAAGSAMDIDTAIAEALATPPPAAVPAMMFGASTAVTD